MGIARFLYNNLITSESMLSVSSLRNGLVTACLKEGAGSATMTAGGIFTGAVDTEYIVEIDSIAGGAEVGQATFRWSDGSGSWDASGVVTGAGKTLNNGITVTFTTGTGADFVVGDRWYFKGVNYYNAGKMIDWDRDHRYRSKWLETPNFITVNFGEPLTISAMALWDHNLTSDATLSLKAAATIGTTGSNLITGWTNSVLIPYDTLTASGANITSAIASSTGTVDSNSFSVTAGSTYGLDITVDLNSGTAPYLTVLSGNAVAIDYQIQLVNGLNSITYNALVTGSSAVLLLSNGAAGNWSATVSLAGTLWTTPDYTATPSYNADHILSYLATPQTYQYWQLQISDPTNPDGFIEIGELFLGGYLELSKTFQPTFDMPINLLQSINETPYGVSKRRFFNQQESFPHIWTPVPIADVASIRTMLDTICDPLAGTVTPIYFNTDSATPNDTHMVNIGSVTPAHVEGDYYSISIEMTEAVTSA